MPHARNRNWIEIQKKLAGFHHPSMNSRHDTAWVPNTDVVEYGEGAVVHIELAGVNPESLHLTLAETVLIITGRRPNPHTGGTAAGFRFRQMEIEYGAFERIVQLPFPVDRRKARARSRNGMVEVLLPRSASATRRKTVIEIQW